MGITLICFSRFIFFMCGNIICLHVCKYIMCACSAKRPKAGVRSLELEFTDGHELPSGYWNQKCGLWKKPVCLTIEPSLQTHVFPNF